MRQRRAANHSPGDTERLGDEVQHLPVQRAAVCADQQQHLHGAAVIPRDERRRDATADASCGTVTVHLALARVHYSQIALTVNDLPAQLDFAEVHQPTTRAHRVARSLYRSLAYFQHLVPAAPDQRAFQSHLAAVCSGHQPICPMLPRSNQQKLCVGTGQRWIWTLSNNTAVFAKDTVFKPAVRKR